MSDSPHILTGDEEIAQFLKVSVVHVRRHGDGTSLLFANSEASESPQKKLYRHFC